MPEALRMWLDSLAPLSGSRRVNRDSPMGIPARAMSVPHRQLWPTVTTKPKMRMPDRLGQRVGEVVPAEDPAPALGGIGVGEVRVVDGVVHAGSHRGDQVEEGEGPHVGGQAHQRGEDREDQQGHPGHHLATAPVGPQGQRHRPQQLGHRAHEGHRPEGGVVDVERVLEVGPDDGDAVAEGARHDGRRGQEHQGGEAVAAGGSRAVAEACPRRCRA